MWHSRVIEETTRASECVNERPDATRRKRGYCSISVIEMTNNGTLADSCARYLRVHIRYSACDHSSCRHPRRRREMRLSRFAAASASLSSSPRWSMLPCRAYSRRAVSWSWSPSSSETWRGYRTHRHLRATTPSTYRMRRCSPTIGLSYGRGRPRSARFAGGPVSDETRTCFTTRPRLSPTTTVTLLPPLRATSPYHRRCRYHRCRPSSPPRARYHSRCRRRASVVLWTTTTRWQPTPAPTAQSEVAILALCARVATTSIGRVDVSPPRRRASQRAALRYSASRCVAVSPPRCLSLSSDSRWKQVRRSTLLSVLSRPARALIAYLLHAFTTGRGTGFRSIFYSSYMQRGYWSRKFRSIESDIGSTSSGVTIADYESVKIGYFMLPATICIL